MTPLAHVQGGATRAGVRQVVLVTGRTFWSLSAQLEGCGTTQTPNRKRPSV